MLITFLEVLFQETHKVQFHTYFFTHHTVQLTLKKSGRERESSFN